MPENIHLIPYAVGVNARTISFRLLQVLLRGIRNNQLPLNRFMKDTGKMATEHFALKNGVLYAIDSSIHNKRWLPYEECTQYKNGNEVDHLEAVKAKLEGKADGIWIAPGNIPEHRIAPLPNGFPNHSTAYLAVPQPFYPS